jgi:DNA polymerase III delta prime subunit
MDEISRLKEYAIYSDNHTILNSIDYTHDINIQTDINTLIREHNKLTLNTYQSFIKNLFNPSSLINKLLLIHGTGTGKTITSLAVANEYIKQFKQSKTDDIRNVIILGFTHDIFKKELLAHPEFGFITKDELDELQQLDMERYDNPGVNKKIDDIRKAYSRRFKKRNNGGIFKFYGYKQLFLMIFNHEQITQYMNTLQSHKVPTVTDLKKLIEAGKLEINYDFIHDFRNSLIICDEIHNIYNSEEANSWGLAIETIIDYFTDSSKIDKTFYNSIRLLYLSATPLNSSPVEIVSLINLLNNKEDRVTNEMLFGTSNIHLLPKSESIIKHKLTGKISYVIDDNPEQYPKSIFDGVEIPEIKYLKFNKCTISKFYQETINKYKNDPDENVNSNSLMDLVFPNPDSDKVGIYDIEKIGNLIDTNKFKNKNLIQKDTEGYITGNFLLESNLKQYSAKYHGILTLMLSLIKNKDSGKVFIYHPLVVGVGVKLISNILAMNGFINENEEPHNNTLCIYCGTTLKNHKKEHEFKPARYVTITGYIGKSNINKLLFKFNNSSNINGEDIKILVGSRTMRESHTLKGIRHLVISHSPNSISEMIQIIGRGIRKNSHIELPVEKRNTRIYIFVNTLNNTKLLSPEESVYQFKMINYVEINKIEEILFNISIDYLINFRFKQRSDNKIIGNVFNIDTKKFSEYEKDLYSLNKIKTYTFNTFFIEDEINEIKYIIKRIFIEYQKILTYDLLFKLVLDPPFSVEINTKLFSEDAFVIALTELVFTYDDINIIINDIRNSRDIIFNLFNNYDKKFIGLDHKTYILVQYDNLFIIYNLDEYIHSGIEINKLYSDVNISNIQSNKSINLRTLSENISSLLDVNSIIDDIYMEYKQNDNIFKNKVINGLTLQSHKILFEYIIELLWKKLFKNITLKYNATLLVDIVEYYKNKQMVITLNDLKNSVLEASYKIYMINHGDLWSNALVKPNKNINLMTLPIGHYITNNPLLFDIKTFTNWIEYSNLYKSVKWIHNKKIIGIEHKDPNSMNIDFKIKFLNDESSKGINAAFIPKEKLLEIGKIIGIKLKSTDSKQDLVKHIQEELITIEKKERKAHSSNKIYYKFYENYM